MENRLAPSPAEVSGVQIIVFFGVPVYARLDLTQIGVKNHLPVGESWAFTVKLV